MSNKFKVGDNVRCIRGSIDGNKLMSGLYYTITAVSGNGIYVDVEGNGYVSTDLSWFADRFEPASDAPGKAAYAPPPRKFKVGDRVKCINPAGVLEAGTVYVVEDVSACSTDYRVHLQGHRRGAGFFERRFELAPEAPRECRISRNGTIGSSRYQTTEAAAAQARSTFNDGAEFDIVEIVTVSKHVVRKVVEARA
ncbi:hypothetical protein KMB83_gp47 [Ralstonia phage Anchaing]|uniref:Uncharacterized protein n=1 Tax=Ralstonia phage Anchaing TaxID=2759719 RepID=A0A7G5B8E4_9CAUD|nr:hypothetical protein KMB83_gp47 [Ralstonia phage Anchaing]QMV32567.1 hypothetical protein A1_00047 [Ralstonia phage Anchaing]